VLLELSHELDYATWFFGPFKHISAVIKNSGTLGINVDDIAALSLRSQAELPVSVHLDFCRRDAARRCTLYGSEGALAWDGINNKVTWKPAVGEIEQWSVDLEKDAMFRSQLLNFLACIEQGEAPKVTLDDGIAALILVEAAKQSGTWTALDAIETLALPPDLVAAFESAAPLARANFDAFPRSAKRGILEWLQTAKKPETRTKRIAETVTLAAKNQRANSWRP
jgi:hypothetical protein